MSENDLPPEVKADIGEVLRWMKAHPGGNWKDMQGLFDVYRKGRDIIRIDLKLLDGNGTFRSVDGLSSPGEIFLPQPGGKPKVVPGRKRGLTPDHTLDRTQNQP